MTRSITSTTPAVPGGGFTISCDTCAAHATEACDDCLISCFCDAGVDDDLGAGAGAVVLDLEEERAVRMLVSAGLVPTIRHRATG